MSPVLTSPMTMADLVKREFDRDYCREVVTVAAGAGAPLGAILGRVTADGKYALSPASGETGEEIACAVLLSPVEASAEDTKALVLARGPVIVADAALQYHAGVLDDAAKTLKHQQLAAHGIVVRRGV